MIADQLCDKDELVIINGGIGPQSMYFLHRKGWSVNNEDLSDLNYLDELHKKGARYLFVETEYLRPVLPYEMVFQNDFMMVFWLGE